MSKEQMSQGQRKDETAAGAGTRIGSADCQFKSGDRVKAEVSDVGTVTTLRYVAEEKTRDRSANVQFGGESGAPETEMKDKTPSAEALKEGAEGTTAPPDLRGEMPAESKQQAKADTSTSRECKDCKLIRGRVLKVEEDNTLIVRDRSKQETRIHLDKTTMIGQRNMKDEPFKEGDRIEAYVTPQGHAHSISLMRGQGGIPGDPDAGG
jgi:hypothetical protein